MQCFWHKFYQYRRQYDFLLKEIQTYDQVWNYYLIIYFVCNIFSICYSLNGSFMSSISFGDNDDYSKNNTKIFFAIEWFAMLLFLSYICSKIVYNNCNIHRNYSSLGLKMIMIMRQPQCQPINNNNHHHRHHLLNSSNLNSIQISHILKVIIMNKDNNFIYIYL